MKRTGGLAALSFVVTCAHAPDALPEEYAVYEALLRQSAGWVVAGSLDRCADRVPRPLPEAQFGWRAVERACFTRLRVPDPINGPPADIVSTKLSRVGFDADHRNAYVQILVECRFGSEHTHGEFGYHLVRQEEGWRLSGDAWVAGHCP